MWTWKSLKENRPGTNNCRRLVYRAVGRIHRDQLVSYNECRRMFFFVVIFFSFYLVPDEVKRREKRQQRQGKPRWPATERRRTTSNICVVAVDAVSTTTSTAAGKCFCYWPRRANRRPRVKLFRRTSAGWDVLDRWNRTSTRSPTRNCFDGWWPLLRMIFSLPPVAHVSFWRARSTMPATVE